MDRRCTWLALLFVSIAGCGASCKKDAGSATGDDEDVAIVDLPNVDTSSFIVAEKRVFSKVVHEYMSPCGDPFTLETCVRESRPCKKCVPAAQLAASLVPKGESEATIKSFLEQRLDDRWVFPIDAGTSPTLGPSSAPITIVEFADFQCPHCRAQAPVLHQLVESDTFGNRPNEFKGKVQLVFKEFPLQMHPDAEVAARAALAAQNQGKFWEMHDQLFSHQDDGFAPANLESYARKIGLNVDQWRNDMSSKEVKDRVARDKKYGEVMDPQGKTIIPGTPAIFIDGRKFAGIGHGSVEEQLRDWLRLELQLMTSSSPSAPSAMPPAPSSAAPSASSAPPAASSAK